jgi:hypothetical protein
MKIELILVRTEIKHLQLDTSFLWEYTVFGSQSTSPLHTSQLQLPRATALQARENTNPLFVVRNAESIRTEIEVAIGQVAPGHQCTFCVHPHSDTRACVYSA